MPDLDAAAREFYNEIRALSIETGGSFENILDNLGASSESLASLIPLDKREQLAHFEMNLKQMIEEAKQLASSPARSIESLNYDFKIPSEQDKRSRKSISVTSQPESVVSVIEAIRSKRSSEVEVPRTRRSMEFLEDEEPRAMSTRGRPVERVPHRSPAPKPPSPQYIEDVQKIQEIQPVQKQESVDEQEQAPPLEELEPPPVPIPRQVSAPKATPPKTTGRRGPVVNREPSVGSDRYEDIITETRKRSLSRGPGSRMGSRTSSQMDFRNSQSDFSSIGRLDLESIRNSTKNVSALDLDTKVVEKTRTITPEVIRKMPTPESKPAQTIFQPPPPKNNIALDANQNATAPTLPIAPPKPKPPSKPDAIVDLFPKNIPHWFVITYTYSVVLILILLVANSTPDGKLYIHFTAFWSLVLYFLLEDDQVID